MHPGSAEAIAAVQRELAALTETAQLTPRTGRADRAGSAASAVFTLRLDREELAALERRARARGIKPSVLARNFIRAGLSAGGRDPLAPVVERLEDAVAELRALVP